MLDAYGFSIKANPKMILEFDKSLEISFSNCNFISRWSSFYATQLTYHFEQDSK